MRRLRPLRLSQPWSSFCIMWVRFVFSRMACFVFERLLPASSTRRSASASEGGVASCGSGLHLCALAGLNSVGLSPVRHFLRIAVRPHLFCKLLLFCFRWAKQYFCRLLTWEMLAAFSAEHCAVALHAETGSGHGPCADMIVRHVARVITCGCLNSLLTA